jgi:hypothetical protein
MNLLRYIYLVDVLLSWLNIRGFLIRLHHQKNLWLCHYMILDLHWSILDHWQHDIVTGQCKWMLRTWFATHRTPDHMLRVLYELGLKAFIAKSVPTWEIGWPSLSCIVWVAAYIAFKRIGHSGIASRGHHRLCISPLSLWPCVLRWLSWWRALTMGSLIAGLNNN